MLFVSSLMAIAGCTAALGISGVGRVPSRGRAFLATGMQPEVAAKSLAKVEDEWKAQAWLFVECSNTSAAEADPLINCPGAPKAFQRSCDTVVQALLHGSGGDPDITREYLDDVCGQSVLADWHQKQCQEIATAIIDHMGRDAYDNRMTLKPSAVCTGFWSKLLDGATRSFAQQQAERLEQEKKAAEEAALEAEAEAKAKTDAEAKAKAEAEAKAKAQADAEAKAQAQAEAKAEADAKAKAEADAKATAEAKDKVKQREQSQPRITKVANATAKHETKKPEKNDAKGKPFKKEIPKIGPKN